MRSFLRIFKILVFVVACNCVYSQDTITVVDGSSTSHGLPFYPFYDYTYSQSIFHADSIGQDGVIEKIYFKYNGNSNWDENVQIYMGHTNKSSFDNTSDWISLNSLDLVYDDDFDVVATPGWIEISLSQNFNYNGSDNLVIALNEISGTNASTNDDFYSSSSSSYASIYKSRDNNIIDANSPPSGSRVRALPNLKLFMTPPGPNINLSTQSFYFSTCQGTASAYDSLKLSGSELEPSTEVTLSCDNANFELSDAYYGDFGPWNVSHTIPVNGDGFIEDTYDYWNIRLASSASVGTHHATVILTHVENGLIDSVNITGVVGTSANIINNNQPITGLSKCELSNSNIKTFDLAATCLSADLIIAPPADFEISIDGTNWIDFNGNIALSPDSINGRVNNTNLYARIVGNTSGNYNGDILVSSVGATTQNISISGEISNDVSIVVNEDSVSPGPAISGLETCFSHASGYESFKVSASCINTDVTITAPTNFEISTDAVNWQNTIVAPQTNGVLAQTTFHVRISGGSPGGSVSGNINISTTGNNYSIPVSGNVDDTPEISLSSSSNNGFKTCGGSYSITKYINVDGYCMVISSNEGS